MIVRAQGQREGVLKAGEVKGYVAGGGGVLFKHVAFIFLLYFNFIFNIWSNYLQQYIGGPV